MTGSPPWPTSFEVDSDKIRLYLLNPSHPTGGPKARFFLGWGFDVSRVAEFVRALLTHPKTSIMTKVTTTAYGYVYVFEGSMSAPNGATPPVRTVWQIDAGRSDARLLTATPFSP